MAPPARSADAPRRGPVGPVGAGALFPDTRRPSTKVTAKTAAQLDARTACVVTYHPMSRSVYVSTTLFAATTALYLVTAPSLVNLDGLGYLKLLPHNFAAGHLLFMPLLRAATRVWGGDGLLAGRVMNALLGGLGVAFLFALARRVRLMLTAAAFAASGFAVSYGWWLQGSDVETYALSGVALLFVLHALLSYEERGTRRALIVVTVALAFAVLCHMTHVLLTPLVFFRVARRNRLHAVLGTATAGMISIGAYAYAAFGVRGHDWSTALAWIGTASHGFRDGSDARRMAEAVRGLGKSFV